VETLTPDDLPKMRVLIVELNPFHAQTSGTTRHTERGTDELKASACGFRWKTDRDRILGGPFAFFVQTTPPKELDSCVTSLWAPIIQRLYERRRAKKRKEAIYRVTVCLLLVSVGLLWAYTRKILPVSKID
jgi:hypothetical protein